MQTIEKGKHTSGPWAVRETEAAIQIRAELDFITVAEMSKQVIGDDGEAYAAAITDARLIAAAPEMLEAISLAIPGYITDGEASFERLLKMCRAYTKATGERHPADRWTR